MKVVTQAKYIELVSRFVAVEETRFYLRGIYFEKHPVKGVIMTATNGHVLGSLYDEQGLFESKNGKGFILPISKSMKGESKKSGKALYSYNKNIASIVHCDRVNFKACEKPNKDHSYMEWNEPIDATFPDWKRVVPQGEFKPTTAFSFNPKYFSLFEVSTGANEVAGVKIFQTDEVSPALVRIGSMPEFFGVLMPMRVGIEDKNLLPEWSKR